MRIVAAGGEPGGTARIPGDKSISHRAAILGALAAGPTDIEGFLDAADSNHLLDALAALGIRIERDAPDRVRVHGLGNGPWSDPAAPLEFGNSGTAMRLMAGVLAGRGVSAALHGDASLSSRPMDRVTQPLTAMGARISAGGGTAPLKIEPAALKGVVWTPPVASAQVKSCLLFAGLHAAGRTRVHERVPTRDHTERLLGHFGIEVELDGDGVSVGRCDWDRVPGRRVTVHGDPSAAAFFVTCAAMRTGCELSVPGVCANPYRIGFLRVLERMGAGIGLSDGGTVCGEPVAGIHVHGNRLHATTISGGEVAGVIDELPLLMVAAATASGTTRLRDATELRFKESDRIHTVARMLESLGVSVQEHEDGLDVTGGTLQPGRVDAAGDHRIVFAAAAAGVACGGPVEIEGAEVVATSFPAFVAAGRETGLELEAVH